MSAEAGERGDDSADARAEIVARLTHEIRGPVSTLRGLAGTTLAHYEGLSDEERREFLGLIRQEADRLERTVERVALALRIEADALPHHVRAEDLTEVVRAAVDEAQVPDHPTDLETPDPIRASIDRAQVAFVVRELVENAAAYSPAGSPIRVRLGRDGPDAVIEVSDSGPGVPPERRDAVFERFTDWRPPGYEDRSGPGLGLFISRAMARRHGGDASLVDVAGGGTMLRVRLPAEG